MNQELSSESSTILHVCNREMLRPLRDKVLRVSGFQVESAEKLSDAISLFRRKPFNLVLVDVPNEDEIPEAEEFCSEIKKTTPNQLVAFVCNWRVALQTDCPDEVLRTEFDPHRFVEGVRSMLKDGNTAQA